MILSYRMFKDVGRLARGEVKGPRGKEFIVRKGSERAGMHPFRPIVGGRRRSLPTGSSRRQSASETQSQHLLIPLWTDIRTIPHAPEPDLPCPHCGHENYGNPRRCERCGNETPLPA